MISNRQHFATLMRAERERATILAAIPSALFVWLFYELGRRQAIGERREDEERKLVHGELSTLREDVSSAKDRATGVAEAEKARRERAEEGWRPREHLLAIISSCAAALVVVVSLVTLFATHTF